MAEAARDLVVVESPTKARTLERMLGPAYKVEASFGHIRDLPKSKLGVDLKTFAPEYIVPDDSEKHARILRREAKTAPHVWLPTDREREIQAFVPQEYWTLEAALATAAGQTFTAEVIQHKGHKLEIHDGATADKHRAALADAQYAVKSVEKRESGRNAAPPFTTSTLQQEASRKLGYSVKRTMVLAQQLYEGVSLGDAPVGLITYMRTDSLHVAEGALRQAHDVIASEFGGQYAIEKPRHYKTRSKGAQEAHEAIRPTDLSRTPDRVKRILKPDQLKLYTLIWQRTIASQMAPARFENTRLDIEAAQYVLRANGRRVLFDGFLRVYTEGTEEPEKEISQLPEVAAGDPLKLLGLDASQHFTQPPARFTEASLVKTLEEHGIGRPSTYAPTISTLVDRKYVRKDGRALVPEDVGFVVTDFLREHFPDIVDTGFTARMEEDLDRIASGDTPWVPVVRDFFEPFSKRVEEKNKSVKKSDVTEEPTDRVCPKCGRPVVIKLGRYGRFYSCTGFKKGKKGEPLPEGACDYSEPLEGQKKPQLEILEGEICPECGKPLARRRGRFGPFVGCTGYPDCKYIKKTQQKTGVVCPECGKGELVRRRGRGRSMFYGCERYPECTFTARELPATAAPGKDAA